MKCSLGELVELTVHGRAAETVDICVQVAFRVGDLHVIFAEDNGPAVESSGLWLFSVRNTETAVIGEKLRAFSY